MLLWLGVFWGLNDRRLGTLITRVVGSQVRGQFNLGYAHYDYWSSLGSLILNTPAPVSGGDFEMLDPNGNLVLKAPRIKAQMYVGELVRGLLRTAVSAPFGRGSFIELHFSQGHLYGGVARIQPIRIKRLYPPGTTGPEFGTDINIIATMASRKPKPDDAPPGPGHVRITVDGAGLTFEHVDYEMRFPGWHGRVEELRGAATLRMSTDPAENSPGLLSFVHEVSPMSAPRGEIVLGTPDAEGNGTFAFPLRDLEIRRFGARASRKQDLVFRGKTLARNTPVEFDGRLLDTYCDVGVRLDLSFENGHGLTELVPGGLLAGQPRGRVHFSGPLSSTLPTMQSGRPHLCLAESWHQQQFSRVPEERVVNISGQVASVDANIATVAITNGSSKFTVVSGELNLPQVVGDALGGQVRAEPMHINFLGDMPWFAKISVTGGDPSQVGMMPKVLQPIVAGKLRGSFRVSGHLGKNAHPERIQIDRVDAIVDRYAHNDPLPKEMKLLGNFTYTPEMVFWRNLHLSGETLSMVADRGSVGPRSGKVESPVVEMHGKGVPIHKVLQFFGVNGTTGDAAVKFRLGGHILRPEVRSGELVIHDLDLLGRKFDEAQSEWSVNAGSLKVEKLSAHGPAGAVSGDGSLQLFLRDVSERPADPVMSLLASVKNLNMSAIAPSLPLTGLISGDADLKGTLKRPLGHLALDMPSLSAQDGTFQKVALRADLSESGLLVKPLEALLGDGKIWSQADLRYEPGKPLDLLLDLTRLPLRELPGIIGLSILVDGRLGGKLRVFGSTAPLSPRLEGRLTVDSLTVSGRPMRVLGPTLEPDALTPPTEPAPLFSLLGMVVRSLTLSSGALDFTPYGTGTRVAGRLFDTFDLEGAVFVDAGRPHGDLTVRFGCSGLPARPTARNAAPAGTKPRMSTATASPLAAMTCDWVVGKLLKDLVQLGDVAVLGSGEVRVRFGDDPRPLFAPQVAPAMPAAASCPKLATRSLPDDMPLPFGATLRLTRAQIIVHTVNDDGEDQRYQAFNEGDVFVCTDSRDIEIGQAHLHTSRQLVEKQPASAAAVAPAAMPAVEPASNENAHSSIDSGEVSLSGLLSPTRSDLHILGLLRLELLEHLLRANFRHTHGEASVDVHVVGPSNSLALRGTADVKSAYLLPYDIDTPVDISSGRLVLTPELATLQGLRVKVDGAETVAAGTIAVDKWSPLQLGQMNFQLTGELSARLIQWQFARNLAEARGSMAIGNLHLTGTLRRPIVDGVVKAKELFLNLRRFHELFFSRGTLRFQRLGAADSGRIYIGRSASDGSGEPLTGTVDGDGKLVLNGTVDHSGLGDFMQSSWYRALDAVRITIKLDNARHSSGGVYNVEMTTPGLLLAGNRDEMHLTGDVEVVSGRYMQDFDLADRFLSARRVMEEDKPFWDGDPFLSGLKLGLNVRTRGTFRVFNNIADLRLATTRFTVNGPLEDIAMGGVIRVDSGVFFVPGLRGEFQVKGDSKIEFSDSARWPDTPFVDVRGGARDFDQNDQQRNIELALRGRVRELKVECLSSEGMSTADCASYLLLGDLSDSIRGGRAQVTPTSVSTGTGSRALEYGDPAAKLVTSQLLTNQVADPLREKLRLDTVRIQFGVSTFDLQLCKRFGLYVRMCGLAEWGILGNAAARYRGFGELQLSDLSVSQLSLERIERGFSFLEDTINRFKLQAGFRLPLRY